MRAAKVERINKMIEFCQVPRLRNEIAEGCGFDVTNIDNYIRIVGRENFIINKEAELHDGRVWKYSIQAKIKKWHPEQDQSAGRDYGRKSGFQKPDSDYLMRLFGYPTAKATLQ